MLRSAAQPSAPMLRSAPLRKPLLRCSTPSSAAALPLRCSAAPMLHALRSAAQPSAPMLRCSAAQSSAALILHGAPLRSPPLRCSTPLRSSCVDILRSDAPMLGRNCSAYLFCAAAQQRTGANATYNNSAAPQQRTGATATKQQRSGAAAHWRKRSLTTAQRRSSAQAQGNNSAAAQRNLTTAQRRSSRESIARTYRLERRSGAKQFKDTHCTHAGYWAELQGVKLLQKVRFTCTKFVVSRETDLKRAMCKKTLQLP